VKNRFILISIPFLFGQMAFAQKEYVDPSVKKKRPLLDSPELVLVNATESEVKSAPTTSNIKIKQYCACVNSQRLTKKAGDLHYQMYSDGHVEAREYYRESYRDQADEKKKLINLFVNREELEPSEIDCEVVRVSSTNLRVHLKEIEKLDEVCKFEEIKRKKY